MVAGLLRGPDGCVSLTLTMFCSLKLQQVVLGDDCGYSSVGIETNRHCEWLWALTHRCNFLLFFFSTNVTLLDRASKDHSGRGKQCL